MGDWQPIETAPKDEALVLLCAADIDDPLEGIVVGLWVEQDSAWYDGAMHKHWNTNYFTHWMPLPKPPQTP